MTLTPRRPIPRVSAKRLASSGPLYSTITTQGKKPKRTGKPRAVNPERKASELLRCYGPPARRKWMKACPCFVCVSLLPILADCDQEWRCDQAHVEGDGAHHKAGYDKTVPLCRPHHRMYDERRDCLADPKWRAMIVAAAAKYEALWQRKQQAHLARSA